MQDDNSGPDFDPQQQADEAKLAAEREVLLKERRTKQTGNSGRSSNTKILALSVLGGAVFLLFVIVGPTGALRLLGMVGHEDAQTSTVDMEVDREKNEHGQLEFTVPATPEPEPEKPIDPTVAWNQRFKELQDKLRAMERDTKPEITSKDIRDMLTEYNGSMMRKLEEERKAMVAENARLQQQAELAEQERRRLEHEAGLQAARVKERDKIEKMQRESGSVVVDEGDGVGGGQASAAEGEMAADLDQNERFLKSAASSIVQTSVSQRLFDPARMVVQGTIISAVLETAIDTQLPGNIRAQVMRPVYSFDGSRVLMQPGTMLIGQFNNEVDLAQKRVLIAWNRAVTPEGKSILIGSTGTDTLGRGGTLGNVDNRYGTKFGAAVLISAITAIPTALSGRSGSGGSGSGSGTTINVGGDVASEAGNSLTDQTSGVLEKYLSLPPVIRIPQGEEIRVFVNRDLIFK